MWNRGPCMTSFSKVPQNSFKVIYRDQTTIETSALPAICNIKSNALIFQNSAIFISFVISLSSNWVRMSQSCNVQKLTREMNWSPQYCYWFWSFYRCLYIMYKFRYVLTQFCIDWGRYCKNFKTSFINIFLVRMFRYLWLY